MSQPTTATECLERVAAEEGITATGQPPTREEIRAWLTQFTYEEKQRLLCFLRLLKAEQEQKKPSDEQIREQ